MSTPLTVTPLQAATILQDATPNLFGSIVVKKKIDIRKSAQAEASEVIKGNLYKEYVIKGFATLKDYGKAVNNAKERNEQDRTFQVQERKWGVHWNGSPLIIEHKGRFYLQVRLTKKTVGESTYVDSMGNEYAYERIERFLLAKDKRETKQKSIKATADSQGLEVEESVQIRDIPLDTIVSLAYAKTIYEVVPQAEGATTAVTATQDQPQQAERQA